MDYDTKAKPTSVTRDSKVLTVHGPGNTVNEDSDNLHRMYPSKYRIIYTECTQVTYTNCAYV